MKTISFLLYSWGSTILYTAFLFWLASVPNLGNGDLNTDEMVKVGYRLILYSILFILIYRSLIVTLKSSISRLAAWRSKKEKIEDMEFVLIIETLLVIISILVCVIVAIIEELLQSNLGFNAEARSFEVKDILVSLMSILLTSIIVYSMPVIGEFEVAIKHKFFNNSSKKK